MMVKGRTSVDDLHTHTCQSKIDISVFCVFCCVQNWASISFLCFPEMHLFPRHIIYLLPTKISPAFMMYKQAVYPADSKDQTTTTQCIYSVSESFSVSWSRSDSNPLRKQIATETFKTVSYTQGYSRKPQHGFLAFYQCWRTGAF